MNDFLHDILVIIIIHIFKILKFILKIIAVNHLFEIQKSKKRMLFLYNLTGSHANIRKTIQLKCFKLL